MGSPHTAWIPGLLLTLATLANCGTLIFTEPNDDGQCYVQLEEILECTGQTSDSVGEVNWEGYCSKCTNLPSQQSLPFAEESNVWFQTVGMMPDNPPTTWVTICDKYLYVTWSKDLWDNHIAHFQLGHPYEDERLDLVGIMNYERGQPNNVAVTTPLPSW
ncbi:hypothetical protein N7474_007455 [Penicillium riverlandense]|uniref:uncharacterized protein n=1 Tax=Penicillium riverlandense TaxID=1903569 RepID=UPI002547A194|nr:uncharacterized protein N7474_007455 [Penicillium riverlandense]KAJ5815678.1 hypothetical protein N7474_007455 [Penicillium riverlandense]